MDEECISTSHIQKLDHELQEIRNRALMNIISKLQRGFVYDNELARCKEILLKLIRWFQFEHFDHEATVLELIISILKSESGKVLINLFGVNHLIAEISDVKNVISNDSHSILEEILALLNEQRQKAPRHIVPPLECDVPLSYRSDDYVIESTAPSITGFVHKSASIDVTGNVPVEKSNVMVFHCDVLPWQSLITPDRHVLESVEDTLRNSNQPSAILNSCEFFSNVLLHDFPAEIFLQRPSLVKLFHDLLWSSPSSRITTAILKCLKKLTSGLKTRIYFYNDSNTFELNKIESPATSQLSSPSSDTVYKSADKIKEEWKKTQFLMKKQITLSQYCMNTIVSVLDYLHVPSGGGDGFKRRKCQVGINTSLALLTKCIDLLKMCIKDNKLLSETPRNDQADSSANRMNNLLAKFGEVLEYFRLEAISSDWNPEMRIIHLYLLCSFINLHECLISDLADCNQLLPKNLKNEMAYSLLDPTFSMLLPGYHEKMVFIAKKFDGSLESELISKYDEVKSICKSMKAAIKFLRNYKSLPTVKNIFFAKEAMKSLEIHKSSDLLKNFVNICANKLSLHCFEEEIWEEIDYIIVSCLAHSTKEIKSLMYNLCKQKVISSIGAKTNTSKYSSPGNQILFLLRTRVLEEIVVHGLTSEETEVESAAEEILVHILKCKILVSDEIWLKVIETLLPIFPLLICHVGKKVNTVGKTLLSMLDPDRSAALNIPLSEIFKGNCALLYTDNIEIREEAVSRLCWLLSSSNKEMNLLPHINSLQDKTLGYICQVNRTVNLNKAKVMSHFYQPSGLIQVLELLNSSGIEPVIRRSATTQISVMLEDPILHETFINNNGMAILRKIMLSALTEHDYKDYTDSVIPCIASLKNLCLYDGSFRQMLSYDPEIFIYVLRGMFLFCTEERVTNDGSILLFLLTFSNFILGSPIKHDLSVPLLVKNTLNCPFQCNQHWNTSRNMLPSLKELINDKWASTALDIYWNLEWFGTIDELLKNKSFPILKSSSLEYNLNKYMQILQNSNAKIDEKISAVHNLTICVLLYNLVKNEPTMSQNLKLYRWEETFDMYLKTPPSGAEDFSLLTLILQLLKKLTTTIKTDESMLWLQNILTDKNHYFVDYLATENVSKEPEVKLLNKALIDLIKATISTNQRYCAFKILQKDNNNEKWKHIVDVIVEHLQFNDAQHFYNLAYLDHLLSLLVLLTSAFGWSGYNNTSSNKSTDSQKKIILLLIRGLYELIDSFHCGKGSTAAESVMGLSIIRHTVLILNHVLAEIQQNVKNWEIYFMRKEIGEDMNISNLCSLRLSRDVVVRSGVFHLLAGLATTTRAAVELVQDIKFNKNDIWDASLCVILNHEEASTVKENAALLLANLTSQIIEHNGKIELIKSVWPTNLKYCPSNENVNSEQVLLNLLEEHLFFKELDAILGNLYLERNLFFNGISKEKLKSSGKGTKNNLLQLYARNLELIGQYSLSTDTSSSSSDSASKNELIKITTPGFISTLTIFINNLLIIASETFSTLLLENGLIKLFFKCISLPSIEIQNTKDLSLNCDILEMNTMICTLLKFAAQKNYGCLSALRNTRDCLSTTISLLNPDLYFSVPQVHYLRNKMWSAVFNLLETMLDSGETEEERIKSNEFFEAVANIIVENGQENFLSTICESIKSPLPNELQLSALSSLTTLLYLSKHIDDATNIVTSRSMQSLLDLTKTPRTPEFDDLPKLSENELEHVYFNSFVLRNESSEECTKYELAGAEICKLLLHLYEVVSLKNSLVSQKRRFLIVNTLTSLLAISREAKNYAFNAGLLPQILRSIKEISLKLSVESIDCLRRISDKKRVCPILKELEYLVGLLTNFMMNDERVKNAAAALGLADVAHKIWIWCGFQKILMTTTLKMLCTFTNDCLAACQSIPLTSSVAGTGLRKVPSNTSILVSIASLVTKEIEQVSRTHDLRILGMCFHLLHNCIKVVDCRVILTKCNVFQSLSRLNPAITKRQKPWENVELLWLDFLNEFTIYPEGQITVLKLPEVLDLLITFAQTSKGCSKQAALEVLRNLAFHQQNRAKLLTSGQFIEMLCAKLSTGTNEEIDVTVTIIWTLLANNQKAKLVFKCAHVDSLLQEALKAAQLSGNATDNIPNMEEMTYVLRLLKDGGSK